MHPHDFEAGTLRTTMPVRADYGGADLLAALFRAGYAPSVRVGKFGPGGQIRATLAFDRYAPGIRRSIWVSDAGWLIPELHLDHLMEIPTAPRTRSAVKALAAVEALVAKHAGA